MKKKLVLVGGGHTHMMTLQNLDWFTDRGHEVTVIGQSRYHYYSGMGPGMLGRDYSPEDVRFDTRKTVESKGSIFLESKASDIDPESKHVILENGEKVPYDVLSLNVGSHMDTGIVRENNKNLFTVKPIENLHQAGLIIEKLALEQQVRVAVVGGGPSAAEISGNIASLGQKFCKNQVDVTVFAGNNFIKKFPENVKKRVVKLLERKGVKIDRSGYVDFIEDNWIVLDSGSSTKAEVIFLATGVRPPEMIQRAGIPIGSEGGMAVNRYLQSEKYPEIFGGGDCIYFSEHPIDKVGVYAVRENPILYHNLQIAINGGKFQSFTPQESYLLILNLGGKIGVFQKGMIAFSGKLAFLIKDYIDRKFIKSFQE
ncbi:NAD(P)/FAD-dependent oxidoreductase [Flexistipes sp.]|uniref:NAD(P)/FAD-dependent oxidoreductase n=1 Tax=Flexistipes sp. TaxID=3088135 RepID=UPI002E1DA4CE|nr:FAD-dependent oxidoreductase [Flexistipes sp.]